MRQNCLSVLLLLCSLLLLMDAEGSSAAVETDQNYQMSHQLEEQCGAYAHKIVEPMIAYFEQMTQRIDRNNREMESKNEEMNMLLREVASCTSKDEVTRELIKSLQQQIDLLSKTNDKLEANLADKQTKKREMRKKCETDLKNKNEEILQLERMEFWKSKVNLLNISIYRKNIEMANVKRQLDEEAKKVLELERQLQSQKEIICAEEPIIPQIEPEIEKLIHKSNEMGKKGCINIDSSGVYNVTVFNDTFEVLCISDIAGPGWTVIQQRIRGGVNFQRDWNTYRNGFGDFWDGDFFLGLDKIHRLTTEQPHELYIHMQYFNGTIINARYDEFAISGEDDQYRLSNLGIFSSTTTVDRFSYHKNMKFTTFDRDNDEFIEANCAHAKDGGWWYNRCSQCNMNGKYIPYEEFDMQSFTWLDKISLKEGRMMIRPKAA